MYAKHSMLLKNVTTDFFPKCDATRRVYGHRLVTRPTKFFFAFLDERRSLEPLDQESATCDLVLSFKQKLKMAGLFTSL